MSTIYRAGGGGKGRSGGPSIRQQADAHRASKGGAYERSGAALSRNNAIREGLASRALPLSVRAGAIRTSIREGNANAPKNKPYQKGPSPDMRAYLSKMGGIRKQEANNNSKLDPIRNRINSSSSRGDRLAEIRRQSRPRGQF